MKQFWGRSEKICIDMPRPRHQLHILTKILSGQLDTQPCSSGRRYNVLGVVEARKQVKTPVIFKAMNKYSSTKIVFSEKIFYLYPFYNGRSATTEAQRS